MSELKLVSPLLDGFAIGDPISDHDGVRCCPAMREDSDDKYIVKVISIPASQKKLDALLLTGAYQDAAAASKYFEGLAEDTVKEARLLQQLSKLEGFLSYDNWQIVPMDNGETGYDVYLLGSYKRSLDKYLRRNTMTHLGAVNLGIDMCTALSLCRRAGFIYTDLKPGNIYVTGQNEYRIGDLGFAKLNAMKYTSLSDRYISQYTAPELHDPLSTLNPTVDTYAVGMILYMIYNNCSIPFETKAPMMILPAPLNADYEMAEIILKACDPNPRKRYQTPVEMGKALVSYMQRNCINDIPIVPPTVTPVSVSSVKPEKAVAPEVSVNIVSENAVAETVSPAQEELDFLSDLVSDDTAPGADAQDDLVEAKTSDEVDLVLAQADDLLSYEPEDFAGSVVPLEETDEIPEEISVATEADLSLEEESFVFDASEFSEEVSAPDAEETPDLPVTEGQETTEAEESDSDFNFDFSDLSDIDADEDEFVDDDDLEFDIPAEEPAEAGSDDFFEDIGKPRKKKGWIGGLILLLFLALLGFGAYYYYTNYYLLPIDNMVIDGFEDSLSIQLTTDADETQLRIICTDAYGNKQEQPVTNGKAVFTDLAPDMMYKITVVTDGFHKLTGSVSGSYTTAVETRIVEFTGKNGIEDGSVILNFTVDGPETPQWTVEYTAEGEEAKRVSFTGHMVTINDLTVGKLYTFTLIPDDSAELYLGGITTLEYQASKIVVAEKLAVVSCIDGVLSAQWNVPEGAAVESWTVRCYAESGYDETISVSEPTAQFANISTDTAYTVEVTAAGMSQSARAFVTANPATVTDVQATYTAGTGMVVTWKSDVTPADGWLLMYSVDGSDATEMVQCNGTTATIKHVIPNAAYRFQVMAAAGTTVFGGSAEHAGIESTEFKQFGLSASQIQSSLCRTPDKDGWTHEDVDKNDYTTSFAPGESASLVLYTSARFYLKSDETAVMFVIRDAEGKVVSNLTRTKISPWRDLWPGTGKYCYLDVPVMPTEYGSYTLEVYFNGATALTKSFSIISDIG